MRARNLRPRLPGRPSRESVTVPPPPAWFRRRWSIESTLVPATPAGNREASVALRPRQSWIWLGPILSSLLLALAVWSRPPTLHHDGVRTLSHRGPMDRRDRLQWSPSVTAVADTSAGPSEAPPVGYFTLPPKVSEAPPAGAGQAAQTRSTRRRRSTSFSDDVAAGMDPTPSQLRGQVVSAFIEPSGFVTSTAPDGTGQRASQITSPPDQSDCVSGTCQIVPEPGRAGQGDTERSLTGLMRFRRRMPGPLQRIVWCLRCTSRGTSPKKASPETMLSNSEQVLCPIPAQQKFSINTSFVRFVKSQILKFEQSVPR